MDRQRYAILVMSLVLGIGGTGVAALIAFDPRTPEVLPDNVPNPLRQRPVQKKKADPKTPPAKASANTPALEVAPPPRPAKRPLTLEEKKTAAHEGCKRLAAAVEAYVASPLNVTHSLPTGQEDLFQPPFGGRPFLQDRESTLNDPWQRPYQFTPLQRIDGSVGILVLTFAPDELLPDAVPITQFGIGEDAKPR
jgi:hypothetical protein